MEIEKKDKKTAKGKEAAKQKEVWNDMKEPLKEDEELEFDASAYEMLHKSNVEWPCLSIDVIIRERTIGSGNGVQSCRDWFPH
jgi:folate-dependent phosphoribosylglycinamide formyltransferase PurN